MLQIQQIFQKLYKCLLYVIFHNLKPRNAGLIDVKKDLYSKRSKGIFVRKNLKKSIVIKNINGSEEPLMHKAECPSNIFFNSFTHFQAEQIRKE